MWVEKALAAFQAGYSTEQIAKATLGYDDVWTGSESKMWQGWMEGFEARATHPDPRIREVSQIGAANAGQRKRAAEVSERREAILWTLILYNAALSYGGKQISFVCRFSTALSKCILRSLTALAIAVTVIDEKSAKLILLH